MLTRSAVILACSRTNLSSFSLYPAAMYPSLSQEIRDSAVERFRSSESSLSDT